MRIITLMEDTSADSQWHAEHGLSFWIEYGDLCILFDTGQSDALIKNARALHVDIARTHAIVVSHGHYDHTGGLDAVLELAPQAILYMHPEALEPKYVEHGCQARSIGISRAAQNMIQQKARAGEVVWTNGPTEIHPGLLVTGRIPRHADFEDTGGAFFRDPKCVRPDTLPDDQALICNAYQGPVVILGCAHAGVVNTLHYAASLTGQQHIYAVLGGMHLLNASRQRIRQTIVVLRDYKVQHIGLAHCTGVHACRRLQQAFVKHCFTCASGTCIDFKNNSSP
jgi:7,8-dihydropterin-6-yl-methyl-4-(beta-D-ribofuranosyl)aminobenzene 5'-phosphate synthase